MIHQREGGRERGRGGERERESSDEGGRIGERKSAGASARAQPALSQVRPSIRLRVHSGGPERE
jgi:hypothetical protein